MYSLTYSRAGHRSLLPVLVEVMEAETRDETGPIMLTAWQDAVEQNDVWDGSWLIVAVDQGSGEIVLRPWTSVDKPTDPANDLTINVDVIFAMQCY